MYSHSPRSCANKQGSKNSPKHVYNQNGRLASPLLGMPLEMPSLLNVFFNSWSHLQRWFLYVIENSSVFFPSKDSSMCRSPSPVFNALNADIICIVLLEKSENGVQQEHPVLQTLGFYWWKFSFSTAQVQQRSIPVSFSAYWNWTEAERGSVYTFS